MTFKATLIISFFNNLKALKLILSALNQQTISNFEVIIADDGSKFEVVEKIQCLKNNYNYPIKHKWHENKSFRKNRILNKAILASESDYLIFIDGDCIPHKRFIEDHLFFSRENRIVAGRRVMMSERLSEFINEDFIEKGWLYSLKFFLVMLYDSLLKKTRHVETALHVPVTPINKMFGHNKRGIKGCNFSVHKSSL